MISKDKWLIANSAADPISQAAERAVGQRMSAVLHYHPLAAFHSEDDVEHVHQLRVWCRRGVAAVDVFAPLLAPRKAAKAKKWLRRIRKSAGDARDLDVLALRLDQDPNLAHAERQSYMDNLAPWRIEAQQSIVTCFERAEQESAVKKLRRLAGSTKWRLAKTEPTLEVFAAHALQPYLQRFWKRAAGDLTDFERLHRLRIAGKELRYTMELLAAGFPKSFRTQLYPLVVDFQERLGRINDLSEASSRWQRWFRDATDGTSPRWETNSKTQRELAVQAAAEFLVWWSTDRIEEFRASWRAVSK